MNNGKLYLIPSPLGDVDFNNIFPQFNSDIINSIDIFIVEDIRTGRRFLKKLGIEKSIDELTFFVLNENTHGPDLNEYLNGCLEGKNIGLMSDAGTPCVADPGNIVVAKAHQFGIEVVPLIGPNSILLSLMGSGLNGQNFAFVGYLPIERDKREDKIRWLESLTIKSNQTQIFIETPYRNIHLFDSLVNVCQPNTRLCIATNLATPQQAILTQSIAKWKKSPPNIHKMPTVFLIGH